MMSDFQADASVRPTLGALLGGGLACTLLSGMVSMQAYMYMRVYRKDFWIIRLLVASIWLMDLFHTAMVGTSLWEYLITHFGDVPIHDKVFWSLGVSVAVTAVITFCVHCFFVHRLYKLSKGNYWITVPIAFFALFRLASACVTCSKMILLKSFSTFFHEIRWVFTLGLVLSTFIDIVIAGCMCYFLWNSRTESSDLNQMIDAVILYTVQNGILTSIATVASLIFWLAAPHNLVYMGLHFCISKLYASSLLASLNARKSLRQVHSSLLGQEQGPLTGASYGPAGTRRFSRFSVVNATAATRSKLEVNVEKTINYTVDEDGPYTPSYPLADRVRKAANSPSNFSDESHLRHV